MKYSRTILFIILFTYLNIYAQEQDSTQKNIQESSLNPEIKEKNVYANKKETSLKEKDEIDNIVLEYSISANEKLSGFTVGWSINQPFFSGQRFELEEYQPIFGVMIASPMTILFSRFNIGLGLGIESGNEKSTIYGTVNMKLFGKFSLIGGIGSMNDDGVHFGFGYDFDVPNIPILIKPFIRANGSFGRKNNVAPESIFFNTLPFLGWTQAGIIIGYKL